MDCAACSSPKLLPLSLVVLSASLQLAATVPSMLTASAVLCLPSKSNGNLIRLLVGGLIDVRSFLSFAQPANYEGRITVIQNEIALQDYTEPSSWADLAGGLLDEQPV